MKDAWLKIYVASRSFLRIPASANLASGILVHEYSGDKVNRVQDLQGQDQYSGRPNFRVTGGSTLQRVMFILIESGMVLYSIQLTRLVVSIEQRAMEASCHRRQTLK